MQAQDARLLRQAAVPTAAAGVLAIVLCSVLVGVKGFVGALIGSIIVLLFFGVSIVVVSRVAHKAPMLLMNAALATYVGKLLVLAVFLIAFKHTTFFNFRAFGFTMAGLTLVWLAAETRAVLKTKLFYVDTDAAPTGLVTKPQPKVVESEAESEPTAPTRGGR